jgi:alkylation response protein AidB-like acyl-CoA dehydrogenase
MFALVRTSRTQKKQQGITFVLIDMTSPGIQIRPLVMTSGEEIQNQVFFDEVRVPKSNVLGQIDDGWTVAKYLLEFERGGGAASPALQVMAGEIAAVAADQPGPAGGRLLDDPAFSRKLADARIRADVLEIIEYQVLAAVAEGKNPGAASSMLKILGTELSQALTELAMETAGPRGRACQPHATKPGGPIAEFEPPPDGYLSGEPWQAVAPLRYFNDRAGSIYAGSNEIQRNILAKAALGL